jgi:hypothetical protein
MKPLLQPWQLLLLVLAGWINLREQEVIEYLRAENRVLREKLGKRRILLNDDQRRRLAVKGKILGRKMLEQVATIVTPEYACSPDAYGTTTAKRPDLLCRLRSGPTPRQRMR